MRIEKGDLVRHFKSELVEDENRYKYLVIEFAEHVDSGDKLVIYKSLYNGKVYARLFEEFMSEVDRDKYPEIKQKYRFEKI